MFVSMKMQKHLRALTALAFGIVSMMIVSAITYVNENSSIDYKTNAGVMISALRYGQQYHQDNYIVITDDDISKYPKLKEVLNGADFNYKMSSLFGRGVKNLLHVTPPYVMWLDHRDALAIINGLNFTYEESNHVNYSVSLEYRDQIKHAYYSISIKYQ